MGIFNPPPQPAPPPNGAHEVAALGVMGCVPMPMIGTATVRGQPGTFTCTGGAFDDAPAANDTPIDAAVARMAHVAARRRDMAGNVMTSCPLVMSPQ